MINQEKFNQIVYLLSQIQDVCPEADVSSLNTWLDNNSEEIKDFSMTYPTTRLLHDILNSNNI